MLRASFEVYLESVAQLKSKYRCKVSNIFHDTTAIQKLMAEKECFVFTTEGVVWLLIPYHEMFYDCLFIAATAEHVHSGLDALLASYPQSKSLRASIIGKEPASGEIAGFFLNKNFILAKKLARMSARFFSEEMESLCHDTPQHEYIVDFAKEDDAGDALKILVEHFDMYGDNIPEISEILENIRAKHVITVKKGNRLAALHYFTVKNNQYHGLYDVVYKEFRKDFLLFYVLDFIQNYNSTNNIQYSRYLAWRNMNDKRLMKFGAQSKQKADGVVIYNMMLEPKTP